MRLFAAGLGKRGVGWARLRDTSWTSHWHDGSGNEKPSASSRLSRRGETTRIEWITDDRPTLRSHRSHALERSRNHCVCRGLPDTRWCKPRHRNAFRDLFYNRGRIYGGLVCVLVCDVGGLQSVVGRVSQVIALILIVVLATLCAGSILVIRHILSCLHKTVLLALGAISALTTRIEELEERVK